MIQRDGTLTSLWQQTTTDRAGSGQLSADAVYDVVIVGGGITGLSTAIQLQEAGKKCVILEANNLCFGTTAGTTAHLNTVMDTPYSTITKNFDQHAAVLVRESAKEAIATIRANIEKYRIDCGFSESTAWMFSKNEEQSKALEDIRRSAHELSVDIAYTPDLPINIPMHKAVMIKEQAKFHPTRYVYGLARAFETAGGVIVENCRVTGSDDTGTMVKITTEQGEIQGAYLIYATHIPPGLNLLDTRCAPYRSYALAAILDEEGPDGLIYDMEDPYHYYRTQKIDGQTYFIAGGEDHKTGHEENTNACFLRLESHVRQYFPVKEIVTRWSSQYYDAVDGLPYIGHMPGNPGRILVATGYGGNGMIYSGVAALVFRELLLGEAAKYSALFNPNRVKPVAGFGNFVRENFDVAKEWAAKWLPSEKFGEFAGIAPGEGRIVKKEGQTMALYKDEKGNLHAVNPICGHMGCQVNWNDAERTWDCPCHGARYSFDGKMLTGPATGDLENVIIEGQY
jgi:glycine/D-amino acid oxidase-like deaminating enzyme/nitrite reductase/ring-hydroxylating ferredoxin subunit